MDRNSIIEQALVEKGVLTADDLSGGAELNAEQRESLADLTIEATNLKDHATVEKVYDIWDYDSLELSGRYAELDNGSKSGGRKPSTYKLKLDPVPLKAVLPLQKSYLRRLATQRLPEEQKAQVIMAALAKVLGNDTERMVWSSDILGHSIAEADYKNDGTGSTSNRIKDETFSKFSGVISVGEQAGSAVKTYDAANSADIRKTLHNLINLLPADYRNEDRQDLRFYVPSNVEENMRSFLEKRETPYGDLIITKDDKIKFRGIEIANMPLLDVNPVVTEHITMNATTARPLSFTPSSASDFYVAPSTLSSTPVTPFVAGGTDYTLDIGAKTIVLPASGSAIGNTATVKVTYRVLPQIFLTKKTNFIVCIGVNDMEQESQYFANEGVLEIVGRTRVAFGFVNQSWVARAINVQDAISA